eukprot:scaffold140340_cov39-Prasinocladus_malaysianus.AAC.1
MECFASPLNCYFGSFCSAFPDTDGVFGSVGSFFDFCPSGGSFEANPPFVPELMSAMARHMEALLQAASQALSFVVVIPAWKNVAVWPQLHRCCSLATWTVSASSHVFCDGAQHQRMLRYRPSSYDTAIIFLQNADGLKTWPPSEDSRQALLQVNLRKPCTVFAAKAMSQGMASGAASVSEYEAQNRKRRKM